MKVVLATMALAMAGVACADTLTWKGTAGGGDGATFASAANWWNANSENQAPATGDTLVFGTAATITSEVDLGNVGYTFQCNADVKINAPISGTGKLTKDGTKQLDVSLGTNSTYSGGTLILNGMLYFNKGNTGRQVGTGPIEIRHASGKTPNLEWYYTSITNDVIVSGIDAAANKQDFGHCQDSFLANITATCDFTVNDRYNKQPNQESGINGTVSAHGHTMNMMTRNNYTETRFALYGTYDCSVYKNTSIGNVYTCGRFIDEDATYSFNAGTNYLSGKVYIACTNILFNNTVVNLMVANPFNPAATVKLIGSSKFTGSGAAAVKELFVNGVSQPRGIYTAENLPGTIDGSACIYVDCYNVWTGATDDLWNTPGNWSLDRAPGSGEVVVFTNDAKVAKNYGGAEPVDIGDGGLTIQVDVSTLNLYCDFRGTGGIVKRGGGGLRLNKASSFTGAIRVLSGEVWGFTGGSYGCGSVVLDRTSTTAIMVPCGNENDTNKVYLVGPYHSGEKTIQFGNGSGFAGDIIGTSTTFCVHSRYSGANKFCKLNSDVYNHGGTLRLSAEYNGSPCNLEINGKVDSNVKVVDSTIAAARMAFNGQLVDADATFEMTAATNILNASAYIACTNIIVDARGDKGTCLKINGKDTINPDATLYVTNGAMVEVSGDYSVYLRGLVIEGERKERGAYSANNCPGVIFGPGRLRLGVPGIRIFLK